MHFYALVTVLIPSVYSWGWKSILKHLVIEDTLTGADKGPLNNCWTLIHRCSLDFKSTLMPFRQVLLGFAKISCLSLKWTFSVSRRISPPWKAPLPAANATCGTFFIPVGTEKWDLTLEQCKWKSETLDSTWHIVHLTEDPAQTRARVWRTLGTQREQRSVPLYYMYT